MLKLAVAIVGVSLFQWYFYTRELHYSAPPKITRDQLLIAAIAPDRYNPWHNAADNLSHLENLPQRIELFLFAGSVVILAMCLGDAIRRWSLKQDPLSRLERVVVAFGLGMGGISLLVQLLGLAGLLSRTSLSVAALLIIAVWVAAVFRFPSLPIEEGTKSDPAAELGWKSKLLLTAGMSPFVILSLLAAALPTTDYDALGYHLLGPKEYFLAGRIGLLPHNVYTTMPFLTEMFHLAGMVGLGDWFRGGLAGQVTLWSFGLMTGLAVGMLAGRLFGNAAGWLAAFVYLTTPWTYRLSSIPYVEGATLFYGVVALDAALRGRTGNSGWSFIAGCLAGCAMASKYPGLVMVIVPAAAVVGMQRNVRTGLWMLVPFALGSALFVGPWIIRNAVWTGNPVYPLAYGIFDGSGWSSEKADRFARAHRSSDFGIDQFWPYLRDIVATSDWQSALVVGFALVSLLALFGSKRNRILGLWALLVYLYLAFWLLTHRLDRFWLPMVPFLAVLASAGITSIRQWLWSIFVALIAFVAVFYNLAYCTTGLCGLNTYTADLGQQWLVNLESEDPAVRMANEPTMVPPGSRVLFVGYAGVYNALPAVRYNTVFDDNLFVELVREPGSDRLKPASEVRSTMNSEDIDFILVDWSWIVRYRGPENYGYPRFVQPCVFRELEEMRILKRRAHFGTPITDEKPEILETPTRYGSIELYAVIRSEPDQ